MGFNLQYCVNVGLLIITKIEQQCKLLKEETEFEVFVRHSDARVCKAFEYMPEAPIKGKPGVD